MNNLSTILKELTVTLAAILATIAPTPPDILGSSIPVERPLGAAMTKVNVIGERAQYIFECNGVRDVEFSTDIDFNERFISRIKPVPTKDGCIFIEGHRLTHFDTLDGFIHTNEYAELQEGGVDKVLMVLPDSGFKNMTKTDVEVLQTIQLAP